MEPMQALHRALKPFRGQLPVLTLGMVAGHPLIADPYGKDEAAFLPLFFWRSIARWSLFWGDC